MAEQEIIDIEMPEGIKRLKNLGNLEAKFDLKSDETVIITVNTKNGQMMLKRFPDENYTSQDHFDKERVKDFFKHNSYAAFIFKGENSTVDINPYLQELKTRQVKVKRLPIVVQIPDQDINPEQIFSFRACLGSPDVQTFIHRGSAGYKSINIVGSEQQEQSLDYAARKEIFSLISDCDCEGLEKALQKYKTQNIDIKSVFSFEDEIGGQLQKKYFSGDANSMFGNRKFYKGYGEFSSIMQTLEIIADYCSENNIDKSDFAKIVGHAAHELATNLGRSTERILQARSTKTFGITSENPEPSEIKTGDAKRISELSDRVDSLLLASNCLLHLAVANVHKEKDPGKRREFIADFDQEQGFGDLLRTIAGINEIKIKSSPDRLQGGFAEYIEKIPTHAIYKRGR
ncbi:MAG: hypothetical protein WCL30_05245 [Pseudomonadota bacterium]